MMPSSQQPSLPDSLSPCSNVRRSCSVLMKDEPCPSFDGANNNTTGGSRSVIIDSASAMDDLADKISHSIMEKYQRAQPEAHTADATSTSVTTNSAAAISEDVNECIDNLDFASWDADGKSKKGLRWKHFIYIFSHSDMNNPLEMKYYMLYRMALHRKKLFKATSIEGRTGNSTF